jgi:SAM-dependent methyltransferase
MMMLRQLLQALKSAVKPIPLCGPFYHYGGHCWMVRLPPLRFQGNDDAAPEGSPMVLFENRTMLQPAHAEHEDIRDRGCGAFSHWHDWLFFSTLDNSDPNNNGRSYCYSLIPGYLRHWSITPTSGRRPVNYQKRDCRPERIEADVAYAMHSGQTYVYKMRQQMPSIAGKTVLEVGPGINFGVAMVMAAYGVRPVVVDRFLAPWQDEYHRPFYAALRQRLASQDAQADVKPLSALLEENGYLESVIRRYECDLEDLCLPSSSCDAVLSNAVVEHLYELKDSFAQLYRVTRPGGFGIHQVDFRDHRSFDRPLEFLLLKKRPFQAEFARRQGNCGNRRRVSEVAGCFRTAGFDVLDFEENCSCTAGYLAEFLPRLRAAKGSPYRYHDAKDLQSLSGTYTLRKPRCAKPDPPVRDAQASKPALWRMATRVRIGT